MLSTPALLLGDELYDRQYLHVALILFNTCNRPWINCKHSLGGKVVSNKLKNQKVDRSYHFFREKEKSKAVFTTADIEKAAGWKKQTVKSYLTKKWDKVLEKKGNGYIVKHLSYTLEEYERMMSQKDRLSNDPTKPDLQLEVERMVIKAREAAILETCIK